MNLQITRPEYLTIYRKLEEVQKQADKLADALKFYADADNYCWDDDGCELAIPYQDGNLEKIARAALDDWNLAH